VNVQAAIDVITAAINQEHLAAPAPQARRAARRRVAAAGRQQGGVDAFSRVM